MRLFQALCVCIPLAVLLAPGWAAGQEEDDVVPELWLDYNPSYSLSPKVDLYGDVGARTEIESEGWWRFIVRPNVRYSVSDAVIVAGGIGSFYTLNQDIEDRWEIRPWQGVTAVWPRLPFQLQHVFRLEERFEFNTETWRSTNSLRARYRLRASKRWGGPFRASRFWRILGSIEGFATLGGDEGQAREQVRVTGGFETGTQSPWRFRLELTWQKAGLLIGDGSFSSLFVRLRLFQNWSQ